MELFSIRIQRTFQLVSTRKLNQLKGKTECDRLMLEKHRKTLVVCEKCYAKIHNHAK